MNKNYPSISALSLALAAITGSAYAQDNSKPASAMLEEVIVTAEKRANSAQTTAIALSALSGDTLSSQGISSGADLNGIAPSLTAALSNGQLQLTMRGVGNEIILSGVGEAGVAPHSNGVYLGSNVTATAAFFDIDRIEIMRGPQGTLWGRNSTGGAINVIQNRPTEELDGYVALDYGRFNNARLEAALGGPISDKVKGRIAVQQQTSDGYLTDKSGSGNDLGDEDSLSIRASLAFSFGDSNEWLLAVGRAEWDINGRAVRQEGTAFAPNTTTIFGLPGGLSFSELSYGSTVKSERFETYATNDRAGEQVDISYATSELTLDFENSTLTLLTDAREHDRVYRLDGDFTSSTTESVYLDFYEDAEEFSQEIRLSSNGDGNTDWVLGGYFYKQDLKLRTTVEWGPYPGLPDFLFQGAFGPEYPEVGVDFGGTLSIESLAAFGQATHRISDSLAVTVGLRYSEDEKKTDEYSDFYAFGLDGIRLQNGNAGFNETWSDWTGKVGLEYTPSDNVLVFANLSKGYKSGGINVGALSGPFAPEELMSYELGLKSQWLDDRLRINATAYFSDFQGYQLQSIEGVNTIITNADAEIAGFELEMDYIPAAGWELSLLTSLTDSELTAFANPAMLNPATNGPVRAGGPTPRTPDLAYRASVTRCFNMEGNGDLSATLNYSWQDDINLDPFGTYGATQTSYGLIGTSLSYVSQDSRWHIDLYGQNLTNEYYKTGIYYYSVLLGSSAQAQVGKPRTYGIRIRREF